MISFEREQNFGFWPHLSCSLVMILTLNKASHCNFFFKKTTIFAVQFIAFIVSLFVFHFLQDGHEKIKAEALISHSERIENHREGK